jgi:hypothetical protein
MSDAWTEQSILQLTTAEGLNIPVFLSRRKMWQTFYGFGGVGVGTFPDRGVPLSGQCHLHRYKRSWPPVR